MATLPLILAVAAISIVVTNQSRHLAETEINALEFQLFEAEKVEFQNYVILAKNTFFLIYVGAALDDEEAKLRVI